MAQIEPNKKSTQDISQFCGKGGPENEPNVEFLTSDRCGRLDFSIDLLKSRRSIDFTISSVIEWA